MLQKIFKTFIWIVFPLLRQLKSGFVDFNLHDKIHYGRTSDIDNDLIRDLMNNNPLITTKEITERLNVENLTAFRHLKQLGYTSKFDASEIGSVADSD